MPFVYVLTSGSWLVPGPVWTVLAVAGVVYFAWAALVLVGIGWYWLEERLLVLPWWAKLPLAYAGAVLLLGGIGWLMGA